MDTRSISANPSTLPSQLEVPTKLQNTAAFKPNALRDASPDDRDDGLILTAYKASAGASTTTFTTALVTSYIARFVYGR